MLDYNLVKRFHAKKLAEDAEGDGRVESAFYHTMKMVYHKGVEDGADGKAGILDQRADRPAPFIKWWLNTDTFIAGLTPHQTKRVRSLCESAFNYAIDNPVNSN